MARMTVAKTTALAESIRAILADPDAALSPQARARWEGALTALEWVLGVPTSMPIEDPGILLL